MVWKREELWILAFPWPSDTMYVLSGDAGQGQLLVGCAVMRVGQGQPFCFHFEYRVQINYMWESTLYEKTGFGLDDVVQLWADASVLSTAEVGLG